MSPNIPELSVRFSADDNVIIKFDEEETDALHFISPLTINYQKDIRWYLETYATHYTTDVDDKRANNIANKLPQWGEALFQAIFKDRVAQRLFNAFQNEKAIRLLTISASHPAILSLPWELLRDPTGTYLFLDNPRISIRRRLAGAGGGRKPFKFETRERLRLLFVISRPSDAPFIDPRSDAIAVLDALEEAAPRQIEVEFLRPATLDNLIKRLEDRRKPVVDIVHFDGHGTFDEVTGYLIFENPTGEKALISAEKLGDMLYQQKISLVVLSACQSATVGEDAMGSVAARLTHVGIPTVLAMTHSVLTATTHRLFAEFYRGFVDGQGVGEALDNARRQLYLDSERGERQRGERRITLKLQDWFLPALYQVNKDVPLLQWQEEITTESPEPVNWCNLPSLQEAGFFGRSYELWFIERAFGQQGTRRLTLSGFGGQGKTYLAIEAGRWLYRTGMFEKACFVDYAAFQGIDAVSLAVSTLATVLEKNLIDAIAANQALSKIPTLLILDNLEAIQAEALQELLNAAKQWSEIGNCRVLLTTRTPDFQHPDYPIEGSLRHQALSLQGLAAEDALAYFQSLLKLPPAPQVKPPEAKALLHLFEQVDFHPLSIGLLAQQLKVRRPAELGEHLAAWLAETPDNPLLASLNLSLERVDEELDRQQLSFAQQLLPRLGVFKGGALEPVLLEVVTGIPVDNLANNGIPWDFFMNHGEELLSFSELYGSLLPLLKTTGLIQVESLPSITTSYLKFHPTLASALWSRLSTEEQTEVLAHYRQCYYKLSYSADLHDTDNPYETRTIVQKELPNLLSAVYNALDAKEIWSIKFAADVNDFLRLLGLYRDRSALIQKIQKTNWIVGSRNWCLTHKKRGEYLHDTGDCSQAIQVFNEILEGLGEHASHERASILGYLGNCFIKLGDANQALDYYDQSLSVAKQLLEMSKNLEKTIGGLQIGLANALVQRGRLGDYNDAEVLYKESLTLFSEYNDVRQQAVIQGALGVLYSAWGDFQESIEYYCNVLEIFQSLKEPEQEAKVQFSLGSSYWEAEQWDEAEKAFREAARIEESLGHPAGAAAAWGALGTVAQSVDKIEDAENWYLKALKSFEDVKDKLGICHAFSNLANLLQNQPNRLPEARKFAENALNIAKTLDPTTTRISNIYTILATIAKKQGDDSKATEYLRLSREAKAISAKIEDDFLRYHGLVSKVINVVRSEAAREELELEKVIETGYKNLVIAIEHILDGERNREVLCNSLNGEEFKVIDTILRLLLAIENPGQSSRLG